VDDFLQSISCTVHSKIMGGSFAERFARVHTEERRVDEPET